MNKLFLITFVKRYVLKIAKNLSNFMRYEPNQLVVVSMKIETFLSFYTPIRKILDHSDSVIISYEEDGLSALQLKIVRIHQSSFAFLIHGLNYEHKQSKTEMRTIVHSQ